MIWNILATLGVIAMVAIIGTSRDKLLIWLSVVYGVVIIGGIWM